MENKTIDIEPRAAVEMPTWENIYDQECPSKAEINDKLTHACTTDSNELADYSSITLNFSERDELTSDSLAENWVHNSTTQRDIQSRFSIESTNECMTKAEFIANLPTPPFLI